MTRPALDSGYSSAFSSSERTASGSSESTLPRRSSGTHSTSSSRSSISRRLRTLARRSSLTASKTSGSISAGSSRSTRAARRCRKSRSITVATSSWVRPESSGAMSAGAIRASRRSARALTPLASRRRKIRVVTCGVAMLESPWYRAPGPSKGKLRRPATDVAGPGIDRPAVRVVCRRDSCFRVDCLTQFRRARYRAEAAVSAGLLAISGGAIDGSAASMRGVLHPFLDW